jgi:hypothetical protein
VIAERFVAASDEQFRLLGISGSIRQRSTNTLILETLAEQLDDRASLAVFPLNDVPLYNVDLEDDRLPDLAQTLKLVDESSIKFCPEASDDLVRKIRLLSRQTT